MILKTTVTEQYAGRTLASLLKREFGMSRNLLRKLKKTYQTSLNGTPCRLITVLAAGDVVEANIDIDDPEKNPTVQPIDLQLEILYEDDGLFVINKRPGIVTHPVCNHVDDTMANGVAHLLIQRGRPPVARPVSRLDRDTSGVMIFAKNTYFQETLIAQMKTGCFQKEYLALVPGKLNPSNGTVNAPISRTCNSIMLREVSANAGNEATTHYETLSSFTCNPCRGCETATYNSDTSCKPVCEPTTLSLVRLRLETGRTHQIRVHMKHIHQPILGDDLYGDTLGPAFGMHRQALHSWKVSFIHPLTRQPVRFSAPLPEDMKKLF